MEKKFLGFGFPFSSLWSFGEISNSARRNYKIKILNTLSRAYYIMLFIFCGYVMFIESNPRHPPRAFPLGLRVPRFDERAKK